MLFDWFTFTAQLVNFVILALLLRHFLYRRILRAVDEREREITNRLQEAERERNEAKIEHDAYLKMQRDWNDELEERLARAKRDVGEKERELLDRARDEVGSLRERWHDALRQERASFLERLRDDVGRHTHALARRAFSDLANAELERHILDVFVESLQTLSGDVRRTLAASARAADGRLTIRSAYSLSGDERQKLISAVHEVLGEEIELELETSPELICGIELVSRDHRLGWNLAGYLTRLEEETRDALLAETSDGDESGEPSPDVPLPARSERNRP